MKYSIRFVVFAALLFLPLCAAAQTWNPISPYGGPGRGIAIDSSGGIYVGFHKRYGGAFKSTDDGATWTFLPDLLYASPGEIAVSSDGTLFVGDMPGTPSLYHSTDDGESWGLIFAMDLLQTNSINVAPDGTLYFGFLSNRYEDVMFMSKDTDELWTLISPGFGGGPLDVAFDDEGGVWLVTKDKIFVSPEGDNVWEQMYESDLYLFRDIATLPDGSVCALKQDAVVRSVDDGQSWETVLTSSRNLIGMGTNKFGQMVAYTADGMLYLSDDNGAYWTDSLQTRFNLNQCISVEKDVFWMSGSPGGVYRMNFRTKMISTPKTGIDRLAFTTVAQFDNRLIAGGIEGNLYIENLDNRAWQEVLLSEAHPVTGIVVADEATIIAGLQEGGLYRSTDGGDSWTRVAEDETDLEFIASLAKDSTGALYAGTNGAGVYVSYDDGLTWGQLGLGDLGIWSMCFTRSGKLLFGGNGGWFCAPDENGELKRTRIPSVTSDIQALAINEDDVIYAGTWSDGLYRSTDGGAGWEYFGFADTIVDDIHTRGRDTIHLGTYYGYYLSVDGGATWQKRTGGMFREDGYVQKLAITPFGTFAATTYGLYAADMLMSAPGAGSAGVDEAGDHLYIYRDGTDGPVGIRMELQKAGSAGLDVYDVLGRRIDHIEYGSFSAGLHRIEYDASVLPGGRYFVVLKTHAGITIGDLLIGE